MTSSSDFRTRITVFHRKLIGRSEIILNINSDYTIAESLLARILRDRCISAGKHGLPAAEKGFAIQHDDPAAAAAADFYVRPGADHSPFIGSAGMGLPRGDHVADKDLFRHEAGTPLSAKITNKDNGYPVWLPGATTRPAKGFMLMIKHRR